MTPPTPGPSEEALIQEATAGVSLLLNDDLTGAKKLLGSRPESCWHLVGSGFTSFLVSALGVEDKELSVALDSLTKAETAAGKGKSKAEANVPGHWWPKGTEFELLLADTVVAQALVHILTESYLEFLKAIYKLNRSYKMFSTCYKQVFPEGVKETDTVEDVVNMLNASYTAAKLAPVVPKHEKSSWGFGGRRKAQTLEPRASSHADLKALRSSKSDLTLKPVTAPSTPQESNTPTDNRSMVDEMASMVDDRLSLTHVRPIWLNDTVAQVVVGGSAFGHGLFELVFALLPPKLRKLTSLFGYSFGNRTIALKLLSVAAMGTDTHASFASLVLLTYYGLVLLSALCNIDRIRWFGKLITVSGWQANRAVILQQCRDVLHNVRSRLPEGTLWLLNEAKIERMMGNTTKAVEILETTLGKPSSFQQAKTVLQFELGWCQVSLLQYSQAGASFLRMRELNQWSHATYTILAAGCYVHALRGDESLHEKLDNLVSVELPGQLGKKRLMGQPPPSEAYVSARIDFWGKKRERWAAQGRKSHATQLRAYEVIRMAPVDELGLQWQTFAHIPPTQAKQLIDIYSAFSPAPQPSAASLVPPATGQVELDTSEELTLRAVLLAVLHRRIGEHDVAGAYLEAVISRGTAHLDEGHTYLVAVAHFETAILECKLAEFETAALGTSNEAVQIWQRRLKAAEKHLDEIFKQGAFLMQSRTESRAQMLRTEIEGKREQLALGR